MVVELAPVFALSQDLGQCGDVGQPEVESLAGEWVHAVRRITRQRPGTAILAPNPGLGAGALQWPGRAPAAQRQGPDAAFAQAEQFGAKASRVCVQQGRRPLSVHRPHHGNFMSKRATQRQKRQHLTTDKPLACDLLVWHAAAQACSDRLLGIGLAAEVNSQLAAGAAVAPLADHLERCAAGGFEQGDLWLKADRLCQLRFKHRHIHDPGQARHLQLLGAKINFAASITLDLHGAHFSGVQCVGPAAQRLQQLARASVQGVGPKVSLAGASGADAWCRASHQAYAQAIARQQQGQGLPNDASAADANV